MLSFDLKQTCKMMFATLEIDRPFLQHVLYSNETLQKGFKVKQNVSTLKVEGEWSELWEKVFFFYRQTCIKYLTISKKIKQN